MSIVPVLFKLADLAHRLAVTYVPTTQPRTFNIGSNESLPSVLLMPTVRNKKPTDLEGPSNILCSVYHELSTLAKAILV